MSCTQWVQICCAGLVLLFRETSGCIFLGAKMTIFCFSTCLQNKLRNFLRSKLIGYLKWRSLVPEGYKTLVIQNFTTLVMRFLLSWSYLAFSSSTNKYASLFQKNTVTTTRAKICILCTAADRSPGRITSLAQNILLSINKINTWPSLSSSKCFLFFLLLLFFFRVPFNKVLEKFREVMTTMESFPNSFFLFVCFVLQAINSDFQNKLRKISCRGSRCSKTQNLA